MAFLGFGASDQNTTYNKNFNQTTTQKPIISDYWTNAWGNAYGNAGSNGVTQTQQPGVDYISNLLKNPWIPGTMYGAAGDTNAYQHTATDNANGDLSALSGEYAGVNMNGLAPIFTGPTPQASASTSSGTDNVAAQSGASQSAPYSDLYGANVINPALAAYDYGTDRAFSALDARTAGAGAFGNTRSGLAYSDLGNQAATGRASLVSQLNTAGLNNAFNYGQQDANRGLTAQTTNAGNLLNNRQFNANLLTANNQFNTNAALTSNNQKLQAANQWSSNVGARAGISSQILANQMGMSEQNLTNMVSSITTPTGINMDAAKALVSSGQITQDQLMQLLTAAQAANGQTADTVGSENGSSNTSKFSFGIGGTP